MSMSKIYCITGKSGSGKDTMFQLLLQNGTHRFEPIIPYTTRPMRAGEVNGESYYFVTDEEFRQMEQAGEVVEKRQYNTVQGVWTYFTRKFPLRQDVDYLYITTLEGAKALARAYGVGTVILIYLHLNDYDRILRCISRESRQSKPDYREMWRRYLADERDFAEENLKGFSRIARVDTGKAGKKKCALAVLSLMNSAA